MKLPILIILWARTRKCLLKQSNFKKRLLSSSLKYQRQETFLNSRLNSLSTNFLQHEKSQTEGHEKSDLKKLLERKDRFNSIEIKSFFKNWLTNLKWWTQNWSLILTESLQLSQVLLLRKKLTLFLRMMSLIYLHRASWWLNSLSLEWALIPQR